MLTVKNKANSGIHLRDYKTPQILAVADFTRTYRSIDDSIMT